MCFSNNQAKEFIAVPNILKIVYPFLAKAAWFGGRSTIQFLRNNYFDIRSTYYMPHPLRPDKDCLGLASLDLTIIFNKLWGWFLAPFW